MVIRLSDQSLSDDLVAHYSRSGFETELVGDCVVRVRRSDAPDAEQEQREVRVHLAVWRLLHPHADVDVLD